jgi:integrase
MGGHNRLSARAVATKRARGRYSDGGGLYLQVARSGTKSWVFRYQVAGIEKNMGLGPEHALSLVEARERARTCRQQLLDGHDPIEARRAERAQRRVAAVRGVTFKTCAEEYLKAHRAGWTSATHAGQWTSTLEAYAYPVFGDLPVSEIDTAIVMKSLDAIWQKTPQTAQRLRGRIESILDWAAVRGFRAGDNPARWRGHLNKLLPAPNKVRAKVHHTALPYSEIAAFLVALRAYDSVYARAVEFAVMTAARAGEVAGARWSEIDLATAIWTVPAARMKGRREHRVPLSPQAVAVLSVMPRTGDRVFPSDRVRANLGMLELVKRIRPDITTHGFRSSFRDWAAERTNFPREVVEAALAHALADKVEAAYRRSDLFEKRRRLMNEWARYCEKLPAVGIVTALRGAALK